MRLGVAVGGVGGDDVANPAEEAGRADPRDAGYDQPEYAYEDAAVVNLPDAGYEKTEQACNERVASRCHRESPPPVYTPARAALFDGKSARGSDGRSARAAPTLAQLKYSLSDRRCGFGRASLAVARLGRLIARLTCLGLRRAACCGARAGAGRAAARCRRAAGRGPGGGGALLFLRLRIAHLLHATTALEDRALFDHQRGRLNVAG